jgi:hypothetical protein
MVDSLKLIWTIGGIGRRLNEPLHRVDYAIKSRGIRPSAVIGNARVFTEDDVARIAAALRDIAAKREGGAPCKH